MRLPEIEWKPISRTAFVLWLGFYALLFCYLAANFSGLTLLDNVHLPIHEGGHLLFSWVGEKPELWGGTILQLLVPALLATTFAIRGDLLGTTFCAVGFFHSLTGVATYMMDALKRELPLVTVGGGDAEHDWVHIFSDLGVLPRAIEIGGAVRVIAWCGLLGSVAWFCWRYRAQVKKDGWKNGSFRAVKMICGFSHGPSLRAGGCTESCKQEPAAKSQREQDYFTLTALKGVLSPFSF